MDCDARGRGVVAVNQGRSVEAVDDDVEVAVIVEIGQGHPVTNIGRVEIPIGAAVFEGQVAAVSKG